MCGKSEATCKSLKIDREEMERSLAALGMNYSHRIVQLSRIRGAHKKSIARAGLGLPAGVLADSHFGTSPQVNQFSQKKLANIRGFYPEMATESWMPVSSPTLAGQLDTGPLSPLSPSGTVPLDLVVPAPKTRRHRIRGQGPTGPPFPAA